MGVITLRLERCILPRFGVQSKYRTRLTVAVELTPLSTQERGVIGAGVAQLARASAFQAEGRGFESRLPLHIYIAALHFLSGAVPLQRPIDGMESGA